MKSKLHVQDAIFILIKLLLPKLKHVSFKYKMTTSNAYIHEVYARIRAKLKDTGRDSHLADSLSRFDIPE